MVQPYIDGFVQARKWQHRDGTTTKLLEMSERTMKRMVGALREKYDISHGRTTTRASELKNIIPIFKGPWENIPPGNGQIDTVAHCGDSVSGDFAYTVSFIDAATYWGIRRGQWNKGQEATKQNLAAIKLRLPFPWTMGHPDTGSEFINYLTKEWCDSNDIRLTRSEPGKKNDNMFVEERNGHVVRKYLGWQRLDADPGIIGLINQYYDVLDPYLNHFQAVRRTLSKDRIGSKYRRTFEKTAKTPYQRLIEHPEISPAVKQLAISAHKQLNPFLLKRKLDTLKDKIFHYQKTRTTK
ncbi:hypothetical protein HY224_03655 [Candidatus Uhrbacteria bacterium]|nr:hypothetical protein [Candidatus Uhrbacteria bacterium]